MNQRGRQPTIKITDSKELWIRSDFYRFIWVMDRRAVEQNASDNILHSVHDIGQHCPEEPPHMQKIAREWKEAQHFFQLVWHSWRMKLIRTMH